MFRLTFRGLLSSLPLISSVVPSRPAASAGSMDRLQGFDLARVRVTDPYYEHLFSTGVRYLLRLDPDRLLAGFRAVSLGQDPERAAGRPLHRGEGSRGASRGHPLGRTLTALAQACRQTIGVDPALNLELMDLLGYLIDELAVCQDRSSNGYLFASPQECFHAVEERGTGGPWDTMRELIAGTVDVYQLTGNPTALDVASRLGDWVDERTRRWDDATRVRVLGGERGGMNASLYALYELTGDPRHLAAARRFDDDDLLAPTGGAPTDGHACLRIPRLLGALQRHRLLGEPATPRLHAAERLWSRVAGEHAPFTSGGEVGSALDLLGLTRRLFLSTGDVRYVDSFERVLFNEILSALQPEAAMVVPREPPDHGFDGFWTATDLDGGLDDACTTGSARLRDGIYFHDATDLFVNLFVSSSLDWPERSLALRQTADVPLSSTVVFTIDAVPADTLRIKLRRPWWVAGKGHATLRVNGEVVCPQEEGGYLEVSRVWRAGDRLELTLPADVRASRLRDDPSAVAFTYGPLVLSAGPGSWDVASAVHSASGQASSSARVTIAESIAIDPSRTVEEWLEDLEHHLVQTPGQLEFTLRHTDQDEHLRFTPWHLRSQDRCGIYFRLEGRPGRSARRA